MVPRSRHIKTLKRRRDFLSDTVLRDGVKRTDYHYVAAELAALNWAIEVLDALVELRRAEKEVNDGEHVCGGLR